MQNQPLLETKEAAEVARLHPQTLARMAKNGEIEAQKFGRCWRFKREVVENYDSRKQTVTPTEQPE